ncbi:hypothetical protein K501DRAFT_281756 [Backusella circina FSU 941]|nr:hypothetical protein K501DRAFT_281756 [Backusella circina FSU 941]
MSDQSPTQSPSQVSTQVDKNVESIKTRIIATSKLIKYVQSAKADLEKSNNSVVELERKLKALQKIADEREKKCEELTIQLQKGDNSEKVNQSQTLIENGKIIGDLKQKISLAEDAKHKAEEALNGQKMYIIQLEARSKELEEESKKASENTKMTDKSRNEMNRKNEELRKANKELSLQHKKIEELENTITTLTGTIDKLDDDAMENSLNNDMIKHELQEAKEESAKMETRLEYFVNENTTLKDEKTALMTQVEELRSSLQAANKSHNTNESIIPKAPEQVLSINESVQRALYLSEAQYEILESENKFLKAKLARLMARQREKDDVNMNDNVLRRQQLLYTTDDMSSPINEPSSDFILDTSSNPGNTQSLFFPGPIETSNSRKASTSRVTSPIATFSPYPKRRSTSGHHEAPVETSQKKIIKRPIGVLQMPPSNVVPAKTKAPTSSSSVKKSRLEKFVKNPSRYATKSSFIPLTQLGGPSKEAVQPVKTSKEASPLKTTSPSREPSPAVSASQSETTSKTEAVPPSTIIAAKEETTLPENSVDDPTTTVITPAPPSYLGKHPYEDSSDDEGTENLERATKNTKLDLPLESFIEKLLSEKKLPIKDDLEKYTTQTGIGELVAEIAGIYRRLKSVANPVAKSGKPVVFKQHGIKGVLMVTLPDHLDKKEKNVSWFLRSLVAQGDESNLYDSIKKRIRLNIMSSLEAKQKDSTVYRLIRLLTSLCKESYDTKFIYRFCFDICRYCEVEQQTLISILNVAYIWSDGLALSPHAEMNEKGSQMILKTVQRVTFHIAQKESAAVPTNLYSSIVKLTKWPDIGESESLYQMTEEIGKSFNKKIMEEVHDASQVIFDDLRCCIIRSLEMIFFYIDDWQIVFDDYIRNKLWPILNEDVVDDIALELLGILGIFGLAQSKEEENKKGVSDLIGRFERLIEIGEEIPEEVKHLQKTAEKGIARLTGDVLIPLPEWV